MHDLVSAREQHLDRMVELILTTGAYRTAAMNNSLHLGVSEFVRRFVAKPVLPHSRVLIDPSREDQVIGLLICGPLHDFAAAPSDWSHYSQHVINNLITPFKNIQVPDSFHIHSLAIASEMQGRGLGKRLLNTAISMANARGYHDNISLFVWANDVRAIQLYYSMGLIVTDHARITLPGFPPLLLMQKNLQFLSYADLCARPCNL